MGRSLKKGPFVNAKLLKAIEEMNQANEKKVIKTWSRPSTIFPQMVDTPSLYTTARSTFLCTLQKTW